jgi:sterol desaturase/sphingolipid hydroxylase (fatty acid hydroxylase superfamily)
MTAMNGISIKTLCMVMTVLLISSSPLHANDGVSPAKGAVTQQALTKIDGSLLMRRFYASFSAELIRYLVAAGGTFVVFYVWRNRRLRALKIQPTYPAAKDIRREVLYSVSSLAVFSSVGVLTLVFYRLGWTRSYHAIAIHGWYYFCFSAVALILLHDAWFYWTHRFMHWKPIFRHVHRVHHLSRNPTPWAAFAFHPIEAVIQAGIFPILVLVMPLHPLAVLIWLLYMTGMNVLGHCGFELLPSGFTRHALFRWHNTSTHHDMHHRFVQCNYGLYYNFWDRLLGTNHQCYDEEFERVKSRAREIVAESQQALAEPAASMTHNSIPQDVETIVG